MGGGGWGKSIKAAHKLSTFELSPCQSVYFAFPGRNVNLIGLCSKAGSKLMQSPSSPRCHCIARKNPFRPRTTWA